MTEAERDDSHAAEAAEQGGPAEAERCETGQAPDDTAEVAAVPGDSHAAEVEHYAVFPAATVRTPDDTAEEAVAASSLRVAPVVPVSSAEFQEDEKVVVGAPAAVQARG